jgi:type I restriction enzyme, S subunit
MIIRRKKICNNVFLHAMLTSQPIQKIFQKIGQGAAVPQLTGKQINELQLPFPPIEIQEEFASVLRNTKEVQGKMRVYEEEHLFNSLTQRAFRGEL